MASFKSNPVYFSLLGVFGLSSAVAGWGIYNRNSAASFEAAQLTRKLSEFSALQSVKPIPSESSKVAVEADLLRTEKALSTMRDELKGRGPVAENLRNAAVPSQPTEVFFNLETFVEKLRQKAQAAEIKVKADERFGFYTYDRNGPERDLIPQVFRQRLVAEYLMDALIDARPSELLSLHRERPLTKAEQDSIAAGGPRPVSTASTNGQATNTDFFDIDPRISARVPGFVGATAFRLTFISETGTLRALLNKLATFELPLVVRGVEVESVVKPAIAAPQSNSLSSLFGAAAPAASAEPSKPKPIVNKVLSKFTVTVELIDLVEAPATEATPTN